MAILDVNSFETNSTSSNINGFDTSTNVVMGTTHVKTGSRAMQITSLASGTARGVNKKWQAAAASDNYLKFDFYVATLPTADNTFANFSASTSLGSSVRSSLTLTAGGLIKLLNSTPAQVGSSSAAVNDGAFHTIELRMNTIPASGSRTLEARLDGSVFATSSVQTLGGTASSYSLGGNLAAEAQTTGDWWFDNIVLTDNTGSFQNTYPGAAIVARAPVNAAGDANGFLVQVGGTAGSANNFTRVNETTPDDATSYNASAVLNAEDLFTINVSGVPTTSTVSSVLVGVRCADITATDTTTGIKLEMMKASGGTKAQSANIVPNSTSWNTNGSSSPRDYQLILYQDPDNATWDPSTWTPQIGYIIDATAVNAVGVTNVWAEVVYIAAAPGGVTAHNLSLLGVGL